MRFPSIRVLVVDDDAPFREALRMLLEPEVAEVSVVPGGPEALEYLATHRAPDVVLLDLMMPGMSGNDVLAELRSHPSLSQLPVILMSALKLHPALARAATAWVRKPLRVDELFAELARCVRVASTG